MSSIFGQAAAEHAERELIPCRDGPLDGETIFIRAPAPPQMRVMVGAEREVLWVGPERVEVVKCQHADDPKGRTVYVYGFCDHHHYHLEAVE